MMERFGRLLVQHATASVVAILALGALVAASTIYSIYTALGASRDVDELAPRVTRIETRIESSLCTKDPKGAACQRILRSAIEAFDHGTLCLLADRLDIPCPELRRRAQESKGAPDDPAPRTTPGPVPAQPGDDVPDRPGPGGSGDDPDPHPAPEPVEPDSPEPPPQSPPPSVIQDICDRVEQATNVALPAVCR